MDEDWVAGELLNVLRNLPQSMRGPVGEALSAASDTADVWMPGVLALWVGLLLACIWVIMAMMDKNRW